MDITIDSPDNRIQLDPTPTQMQDVQVKTKEIALKGKLYTYDDGIVAGENFTALKNYKYMDIGLEGIFGMSKINTTALATYLKTRSAIHFKKVDPAESHVLAEAWNTGLTAAQVVQNTTAIASQGDFSATALWAAASGSSIGRFSTAPGGHIIYANGQEACIWGGNESRVSAFMQNDPNKAYKYDWTEEVRNSLTDSNNIATLYSTAALSGNDSYTKLLLHFDGLDEATTTTDSSASAHTITMTNAVIDTAQSVFGGSSVYFDGSGDIVTAPYSTDFNFGTGDFTIDCNVNFFEAAQTDTIFSLYKDADNFIMAYKASTKRIYFIVEIANVVKAYYETAVLTTDATTWYHFAFVRNGTAFKIFRDGVDLALTETTAIGSNDIGIADAILYIGSHGAATNELKGWEDEFRISKGIARWTSSFDTPATQYEDVPVYLYVGATRPLNGINLYVQTANTETSTMTADYWTGTWSSVPATFSDGSSSGGKSLGATGKKLISFGSTVSTAKPKLIDGKLLYWYRLVIDAVSAGTQIYKVTLQAPFQKILDVWDGSNSLLQSFQLYTTTYSDYTLNVQENMYDPSDGTTYTSLDSLATASNLTIGFLERQQGISFSFASDKANSTEDTVIVVKYWNGSAWTSCEGVNDETSQDGISFNTDGTVTWDPPAVTEEFKTYAGNKLPLYYYQLSFTKVLSADVELFYVRGIQAAKGLYSFNFPFCGGDRVWLCNQNIAKCSAQDTPDVFNGEDSFDIQFGDDHLLTAAAELYCQFGANLYLLLVFTKANETWILFQDGNGAWQKFRVSGTIGCAAFDTMKTANITPETAAQNGSIAIWQGTHGIYMFDGRVISPLHNDIKNYFDRRKSECITAAMIEKSSGFFNDDGTEYHWCFASGAGQTTLNKEFVYVLSKKKWYEVNRTSGKYLQVGISVEDTYGSRYNYGFIDTGYMELLESGYTMDGTDIPYQFALGDLALAEGHVMYETTVKGVGLAVIGNTIDEARVTVKGYCDTNSQYSEATIDPIAQDDKRVRDDIRSDFDHAMGPAIYHRFVFDYTSGTEPYGLRPKYVYINYELNRIKGV